MTQELNGDLGSPHVWLPLYHFWHWGIHKAPQPQPAACRLTPFLTDLWNLSSVFYPEPTLDPFAPTTVPVLLHIVPLPLPRGHTLQGLSLMDWQQPFTWLVCGPLPLLTAPLGDAVLTTVAGSDGHTLPLALSPFLRDNMLLCKCSKLPLTSSRPLHHTAK